jgi:cyclic dehypoxanthinyl futalosine synthase
MRRSLHPEDAATYVADLAVCWQRPDAERRIAEAVDLGVTGLRLQLTAAATLPAIEDLLLATRRAAPAIGLHGLTASDILHLSRDAGLPPTEALNRLQAAGLQSLSGDDAGILDDHAPPSPRSCSATDWLALHRASHRIGLPSTAAMTFGTGESSLHRANHLEAIRHLQQDTGGFVAFRPSASPRPRGDEATAVEYLQTLAISRIALDTIPHIEADWPAQGLKVLQMALRFGADDAGTLFPAHTLAPHDPASEEDLRRIIRGANLRPIERDTLYRTCVLA